MGSLIILKLGNLTLDWAKNGVGTYHSPLFQTGDVKPMPYHYVSDEDKTDRRNEGGMHEITSGR
jgi:hypothetical protein